MDYLLICLVSFVGSGLTLFSGFGLGTLLLPVFALFFPVEIAVALTAIVHFLNNLFKLALMGRYASREIILKFGIPSLIASFVGALLLTVMSDTAPLHVYTIGPKTFEITLVKVVIGVVLAFFALFEIVPRLANLQISPKYLVFGGFLSGFFGGLSGNQGALRSAFLIRANLSKESYIGTGVVIACLVDIVRLSVYSDTLFSIRSIPYGIMIAATLSAFTGAFLGSRYIKKITVRSLQLIVAVGLMVIAILLLAGIL